MYKKNEASRGNININNVTEGETIEQKIKRIVTNGEPITDGAPIIHTERKDGVLPEYNPRTDRFDIAIEAMDKITKSNIAKRRARMETIEGGKSSQNDENKTQNDGGTEPIQGTSK